MFSNVSVAPPETPDSASYSVPSLPRYAGPAILTAQETSPVAACAGAPSGQMITDPASASRIAGFTS
jgi:hypothetical protein